MYKKALKASQLGKKTVYKDHYDPGLLYAIPRDKHKSILYGFDLWNLYEVSWLNKDSIPEVCLARVIYSANSPKILESKAFKLYLNSFNNTIFESPLEVKKTLTLDLEAAVCDKVEVEFIPLDSLEISKPEGLLLDLVKPREGALLEGGNDIIKEKLYSHLFRSNCPITAQPDWATITLEYRGRKISKESLLQYLISFRNEKDFHETCLERIFLFIMEEAAPEDLKIWANFTRRGGLDINPFRTNNKDFQERSLPRFIRQ
jgi:7-cyano-7-deazaguanine reductase